MDENINLYQKPGFSYAYRMASMVTLLSEFPETELDLNLEYMILDAGCSSGATTIKLAELFPNSIVMGMEMTNRIDKKLLSKSDRVCFCRADMFKFGFIENTFDIALMANNILNRMNMEEKFEWGQIAQALIPTLNSLKIGGRLILYSDYTGPVYKITGNTVANRSFIIIEKSNEGFGLFGSEEFYKRFSLFTLEELQELIYYINLTTQIPAFNKSLR